RTFLTTSRRESQSERPKRTHLTRQVPCHAAGASQPRATHVLLALPSSRRHLCMAAPATGEGRKDQMDAPAKRTEQPPPSSPNGGRVASSSDSNLAFPSYAPGEDETALW
ncbi:unnamed protein product, partial [Ectocarpus sp. 12 AP-2014]